MQNNQQHFVVIGILIGLALLSYLIIAPFLGFILLGIILAYMCYPVYSWLLSHTKPVYAASIVLIGVLLGIIIPAIIVAAGLISQANGAYSFLTSESVGSHTSGLILKLNSWTGVDVGSAFVSMLTKIESFVVSSLPTIISRTGEMIFGTILLFIVMFYSLIDGKSWYDQSIKWLPISSAHKKRVHFEVSHMTTSLFYGQFLTSILIGTACGILFYLFGIPSAIFWGFIMGIFAFIPIFGAPMVYIPAGIFLMLNDMWFSGIGIIVACSLAVVFFDYIYRQKIINKQNISHKSSAIHPLIIIVGAIGGVLLMGFVGFIIGPLVLSLLLLFLRLESDHKKDD